MTQRSGSERPPTTWTVLSVARVVDGDTVMLTRTREVGVVDGLRVTATDVEPVRVRLVHVDTPERGEQGWADARDDLVAWTRSRSLMLRDAGVDPFGRRLGDLVDAFGETASVHLVRDRGWPAWGGS